jgi:hypothetical protein
LSEFISTSGSKPAALTLVPFRFKLSSLERLLKAEIPESVMEDRKLISGDVLNRIIMYVSAIMEVKNSLGMICDPIGNRVEAPCLNRNVMAASNALSCANMALADYDHLIPLDEVIETMYEVGKSIPNTLRCTNLGGLSITKTAKEIERKLGQSSFLRAVNSGLLPELVLI